MEYISLLLVFLAGFFIKFTDLVVDDGFRIFRKGEYILGMASGLFAGYAVSLSPSLAPLGFAIFAAMLVTRKIDAYPHLLALVFFVSSLILLGIPPASGLLILIFLSAAVADEVGNDLSDGRRIKGRIARFFSLRLFLDSVVFATSLLTGQWELFIAVVFIDIGYTLPRLLAGRKGKKKSYNYKKGGV